MKEQIINWLVYDRTFESGAQLYYKYGISLSIKAIIQRQGYSEYNLKLLIEELRKLVPIHPDELKHILACPVPQRKSQKSQETTPVDVQPQESEEPITENIPVKDPVTESGEPATEDSPVEDQITENGEPKDEQSPIDDRTPFSKLPEEVKRVFRLREEFPFLKDPDCPQELKILVADMLTAYENFKNAHKDLFTPENEEDFATASMDVVENYLENRLIWDELNHYKQTGEILGKHPIFKEMIELAELKKMNASTLAQKKNNLRSNISQLEKKINSGENPDLNHDRQEKIDSKKRLLVEIERILAKK